MNRQMLLIIINKISQKLLAILGLDMVPVSVGSYMQT